MSPDGAAMHRELGKRWPQLTKRGFQITPRGSVAELSQMLHVAYVEGDYDD